MGRTLCVMSSSVLAASLAVVALGAGQSNSPVARFTAFAINQGAAAGQTTATLAISVTRWSTDVERDVLGTTVAEGGPAKLLELFGKMPAVGRISATGSIGYELKYARMSKVGTSEQFLLVADRPINFAEQVSSTRSLDYPYTVLQFSVPPTGNGTGTMSIATKILFDRGRREIMFENFNTTPVQLNAIRREN